VELGIPPPMPSGNGGSWASPLGAFVGSNPTVCTILGNYEGNYEGKTVIVGNDGIFI